MTNVTPISDAKRQEALAALERAREEGRAEVRAEREPWADTIARATAKPLEAAHAAALAEANKRALNEARSAHAHGYHKAAWQIGLVSLLIGAFGAIAIMDLVQRSSFTAAAEFGREQVLTGVVAGSRDNGNAIVPRCEHGVRTLPNGEVVCDDAGQTRRNAP